MKRIKTAEDVPKYIRNVRDAKKVVDMYNRDSIKYMTDFGLMLDNIDLKILSPLSEEVYKPKHRYLKPYVRMFVKGKEKERLGKKKIKQDRPRLYTKGL